MSYSVVGKNTIVKCDNPDCQMLFSIIMYGLEDIACQVINCADMIPLTGNTPYYCPCCGKNLGMAEAEYLELKDNHP